MSQPGPTLESLLHHLAECPAEFYESCQASEGSAQTAAIVSDFFRSHFVVDSTAWIASLIRRKSHSYQSKRHQAIISVAVWLIHHEWFSQNSLFLESAFLWIQTESLRTMSEVVSPEQFVADPDRREELVRACLYALDLRPLGETQEQSDDRRIALDSVERKRILEATMAAEKRARAIREEMAKKKALESASRYGE